MRASFVIVVLALAPAGCKWWQRHRVARRGASLGSAYAVGSAPWRLDIQLNEHARDIDACLSTARRGAIEGGVTIQYSVMPDGHALAVVTNGTGTAPEVDVCIKFEVERILFRNPPPVPTDIVRQWRVPLQ